MKGSNKMLLVAFVVLFLMLSVILIPSFSNLGDLFAYAENATFHNVSLLTLFKAEWVVLLVAWVVLGCFPRNDEAVDANAYVRRHLTFIMFVIGQVFVGVVAGGFLVHQDASWNQVVRGADEIMPAQAIILLICYPMYLFFGGGAFIYVKTRMPVFLRNKEVAFMVLTFAPLAFLPYYETNMVGAKTDWMETVYLASYWVLSMSWVVFGVAFLIIHSAKEMFKGFETHRH